MDLDRINKFLTMIILIFIIAFGMLLFLEWFRFVDYIPGVGEGSGVGFILESLIRFLLG